LGGVRLPGNSPFEPVAGAKRTLVEGYKKLQNERGRQPRKEEKDIRNSTHESKGAGPL